MQRSSSNEAMLFCVYYLPRASSEYQFVFDFDEAKSGVVSWRTFYNSNNIIQ